jgi:hypothetical protein
MQKIIYLYFLCTCCLALKAQTESKASDINHYAGLDLGYSSYPRFVNNNLEYNLNYFFNPHYFFMKSQFGLSAGSNMGLIYKIFLTMGFSTQTTKVISWHLLTGVGAVVPQKTYKENTFQSLGPIIESGFYLNFFKDKNKLIGINSVVFTEQYQYAGYRYSGSAISVNFNISFNIKLNK